jgi:hypothetical protein
MTPIYCSDPESFVLDIGSLGSNLTIGNTYFIRIYSNSSTSGANTTFDVCIGTTPSAPTNDSCSTAESITGLPFSAMYDASGATNNSGFISASGCINMNDGVWFSIIGDGGDMTFTVEPTAWDAAIVVYDGTCSALNCIQDSNIGASGVVESVTFTSGLNTTYFVNVAYPSGTADLPEGIFDLSVSSTTLSIDEIVSKGFYFYPNPVKNVLKMRANEVIHQVYLYNILGKEIKRHNQSDLSAEINMSDLSSGIYFVKVEVGNASGSFKIIKN